MTRQDQRTGKLTLRVRNTLGRVGAAALGILLAVILLPAPTAQAHAQMTSSNPRDGATLTAAPRSITLNFNEKITANPANIQLINSSAVKVDARVSQSLDGGRTKITLAPTRTLGAGRYAVRWSVTSADGHIVTGAIAFAVNSPTAKAATKTLSLTNSVKGTINGAKVGKRVITLNTKATSGTIELTHPSLGAPLKWNLRGNGTKASASGILPLSGNWTITARLRISQYSDSTGTASLTVSS